MTARTLDIGRYGETLGGRILAAAFNLDGVLGSLGVSEDPAPDPRLAIARAALSEAIAMLEANPSARNLLPWNAEGGAQ